MLGTVASRGRDRRAHGLRTISLAGLGMLAAAGAWAQETRTVIKTPAPEEYSANRFDRSDELKVVGEVLFVQALEKETYVWLKASEVLRKGFGAKAGHDEATGAGLLWRVEGSAIAKLKPEERAKLVEGGRVEVQGDNSTDKTCKPSCRLKAGKLRIL